MSTVLPFLRVDGERIINEQGDRVILKGAGLGGWMNMENFITGYPGREFQIRAALAKVLGPDRAAFFFDKFLEYFFADEDAAFFASLGLNCIRIALNYRHFEDDMNPRVLKQDGFKHLDRVIELCTKHGLWTILDLHTAPGGQNCDWHSDSPTHVASFFEHKDFQDRAVWLWGELAKHYKDNPSIAGYNPLNEPTDPSHSQLITVYDRLHDIIREHDKRHIIFWDGNTFASDFTAFGDAYQRWNNSAYSIHDYSIFGFPDAPSVYSGQEDQKRRLRRSFERKMEWMKEHGLAVWNGEWGPVYSEDESVNAIRLHVLKDQLELYEEAQIGWSIWLYKDEWPILIYLRPLSLNRLRTYRLPRLIKKPGMTYVSPDTPYMNLLAPFLVKKRKLAVDAWGADTSLPEIRAAYEPLEKFIENNIEEKYRKLYPPMWNHELRSGRLARCILVAEYMVPEWAEYFANKDEAELDQLAASFKFENCVRREALNQILTAHNTQR